MKDLSKIRQQAGKIIRERYHLEHENLTVRDMLKGSVVEHYKKCGRKNCICRKGKLHGPYWYLSYKESNRSVLKYIDKKTLAKIERLAANYKKFQSNITRTNKLNKQLGKLMADIRTILLSRVQ